MNLNITLTYRSQTQKVTLYNYICETFKIEKFIHREYKLVGRKEKLLNRQRLFGITNILN